MSGGHCLVIRFMDDWINPSQLHPSLNIHYTLPPLLLFFLPQSSLKCLTLHQLLCVNAQWWLAQWYPADTHSEPSLLWMCQKWLDFHGGWRWVVCKCKILPPQLCKFLHSVGLSGWKSHSLQGETTSHFSTDSCGTHPEWLINFYFILLSNNTFCRLLLFRDENFH